MKAHFFAVALSTLTLAGIVSTGGCSSSSSGGGGGGTISCALSDMSEWTSS